MMAESDLIRGNVDTIILKVLYEGDRYGYDLIKQINARGDGQWEIKQPTVYACLKRLEKQGFVSSYWDAADSDGGRRKYYTLTESGKQVFLKYKNEFERANALFGGLISGNESSALMQPQDDYSDVDDDGYSVPKRPRPHVKRAPQPQENIIPERYGDSERQDNPPVKAPTESEQQSLFALLDAEQHKRSTVPQQEPAAPDAAQAPIERTYVPQNPHSIIERYFAQESGDSYAQAQHKVAAQPISRELAAATTQSAPAQPVAPVAPVAATQPQSPIQLPQPPHNIPVAMPIVEPPVSAHTAQPSHELLPQDKPPQQSRDISEEESPARREYKTVLGELVERYEMSSPDVRPARNAIPAEEQAAAEAQIEKPSGRFAKVEQAVKELGNDVKIRNHNDSAKQYASKNYYFSAKLLLSKYTAISIAMFVTGVALFFTFYSGLNLRMQYDYLLYIAAGLLPIAMFIFSVICFALDPEKTKRVNENYKFSIIIRLVITVQVAVVIYCLNLIWDMPLDFSAQYLPSLIIPLVYSLFIPISEVVFMCMMKSGKYAASVQ